MNSIYKYSGNPNCSTIDLKGGYTGNNISALNVYLNEKEPPAKINWKFLKTITL